MNDISSKNSNKGEVSINEQMKNGFIPTLFATFSTIFLAELGDKTQIATLAISGSSHRPLAVFIGSSSALVLASLLGVLLGGSIAKFIPELLIELLAATGFLVIGLNLVMTTKEKEITDSTK